jgi:hypothetical protein
MTLNVEKLIAPSPQHSTSQMVSQLLLSAAIDGGNLNSLMFCRIHERCYGSNGLKTVNRYPVTAPNSNTSAKPEAQQTNNARQ